MSSPIWSKSSVSILCLCISPRARRKAARQIHAVGSRSSSPRPSAWANASATASSATSRFPVARSSERQSRGASRRKTLSRCLSSPAPTTCSLTFTWTGRDCGPFLNACRRGRHTPTNQLRRVRGSGLGTPRFLATRRKGHRLFQARETTRWGVNGDSDPSRSLDAAEVSAIHWFAASRLRGRRQARHRRSARADRRRSAAAPVRRSHIASRTTEQTAPNPGTSWRRRARRKLMAGRALERRADETGAPGEARGRPRWDARPRPMDELGRRLRMPARRRKRR
jgi:hypothetical protein